MDKDELSNYLSDYEGKIKEKEETDQFLKNDEFFGDIDYIEIQNISMTADAFNNILSKNIEEEKGIKHYIEPDDMQSTELMEYL